jgi:transposase
VKLKGKQKKQERRRQRLEVNVQKLDDIVDRARHGRPVDAPEWDQLTTAIHAMAERLTPKRTDESKEALLGPDNAPASDVPQEGSNAAEASGPAEDNDGNADATGDVPKKPRPGHGRNGVGKYVGATVIPVPHSTLSRKGCCPECIKGRLYPVPPKSILRVTGMSPINATEHQLEKLRCNLCGEIYEATAPEGIGNDKYDFTVASMIAQLKYGAGMPWYRIEKLQAQMGVPMPSGTQCDLVTAAAECIKPVHEELVRQGAQGEVFYHDDTTAHILGAVERPAEQDKKRTGVHTTGVVIKLGEHLISLFMTGPKHAGENMTDLLSKRMDDLPTAIAMSDALAANAPKLRRGLELLASNCLIHGRRQFVDVLESFPEECQYVILELALVYFNDDEARRLGLNPEQRLRFHREHSKPVMDRLETWMREQIAENLTEPSPKPRTEPNSRLGKAINYCLKRWDKLTLFLRHPGAPLDNNAAYAANGISCVMPPSALCRVTVVVGHPSVDLGPWHCICAA